MATELFALPEPFLAIIGGAPAVVIGSLVALGLIYWLLRKLHLTDQIVQGAVHKLEEGVWKKWVILAVIIAWVTAVVYVCFFGLADGPGFHGLAHPRAMEQAGIAKEIARGNGFTTKVIRPLALWQFGDEAGAFKDRLPDTYHAPLWPYILAPFLNSARSQWIIDDPNVYAYPPDKVVAAVSTFFFLCGVAACFFVVRRLFDLRLALFCVGFTLLCDQFWQFALSGLPQMLLFFLFSCAMYTLVRAVEAHCAEAPVDVEEAPVDEAEFIHTSAPSRFRVLSSPVFWLCATAVLFGIMALAHAITLWIFLGVLVFTGFLVRQRWLSIGLMVAIVLAMYSPWLVRNYRICGGIKGIAGLAGYVMVSDIRATESGLMRSTQAPFTDVGTMAIARKAITQAHTQLGSLFAYLGYTLVAPVFFVALLHLFKRREIAIFRWALLLMFATAVMGMTIFGFDDQKLQSNDLYVLFIPYLTMYGMAYVLMMWSRYELSRNWVVHRLFIGMLFLVSDRPFLGTLTEMIDRTGLPFQWPPYYPTHIAIMRPWTTEKEIIMSDMPWAVAWYADRRSLWLPMTVAEYTTLSDYQKLSGPIVGLHLTPVSGDKEFLSTIVSGEYKAWMPQITRQEALLKNFPLHKSVALGYALLTVVYFDRDRWSAREE